MKYTTRFILMLMIVTKSIQLMAASESESRMIDLSKMSNQQGKDFIEGKMPDHIVICPKGSDLNLNMTLEGEILSLQPQANSFKLMQDCYLRCEKENYILFSTDLKQWNSLLKIFSGKIRLSLENPNGISLINFNLNYGKDSMDVSTNIRRGRARKHN